MATASVEPGVYIEQISNGEYRIHLGEIEAQSTFLVVTECISGTPVHLNKPNRLSFKYRGVESILVQLFVDMGFRSQQLFNSHVPYCDGRTFMQLDDHQKMLKMNRLQGGTTVKTKESAEQPANSLSFTDSDWEDSSDQDSAFVSSARKERAARGRGHRNASSSSSENTPDSATKAVRCKRRSMSVAPLPKPDQQPERSLSIRRFDTMPQLHIQFLEITSASETTSKTVLILVDLDHKRAKNIISFFELVGKKAVAYIDKDVVGKNRQVLYTKLGVGVLTLSLINSTSLLEFDPLPKGFHLVYTYLSPDILYEISELHESNSITICLREGVPKYLQFVDALAKIGFTNLPTTRHFFRQLVPEQQLQRMREDEGNDDVPVLHATVLVELDKIQKQLDIAKAVVGQRAKELIDPKKGKPRKKKCWVPNCVWNRCKAMTTDIISFYNLKEMDYDVDSLAYSEEFLGISKDMIQHGVAVCSLHFDIECVGSGRRMLQGTCIPTCLPCDGFTGQKRKCSHNHVPPAYPDTSKKTKPTGAKQAKPEAKKTLKKKAAAEV